MSDIVVPELGESITEATVLKWLKREGEAVGQGEAVAELETDKVNLEVMAEHDGVLGAIRKQAGDTVAVGEVIATVDASGASASDAGGTDAGGTDAGGSAKFDALPSGKARALAVEGERTSADHASPLRAPVEATPGDDMRASPAVRRLALAHGVDLRELAASTGGRLTEQDVLLAGRPARSGPPSAAPTTGAALASAPAASSPQGAAPPESGGRAPDEERVRLSRRRLTIARRLVEAQHAAAMLTTFNEVDLHAILELRKRRKDAFREHHGVGLGFMSFFTKATIGALKAFPALNGEIHGDAMVLKRHYDIGIAVATEKGLVVPVVRDADRLSFAEIEREVARLAERARGDSLTLSDLSGGTFTITNGGVFGSLFSTPILNPPQVGILGMHKIQERPAAVAGEVVIRPMMYVALSYDHRIVDGSEAVRFLARVKELVEDPEALLLEGLACALVIAV